MMFILTFNSVLFKVDKSKQYNIYKREWINQIKKIILIQSKTYYLSLKVQEKLHFFINQD